MNTNKRRLLCERKKLIRVVKRFTKIVWTKFQMEYLISHELIASFFAEWEPTDVKTHKIFQTNTFQTKEKKFIKCNFPQWFYRLIWIFIRWGRM